MTASWYVFIYITSILVFCIGIHWTQEMSEANNPIRVAFQLNLSISLFPFDLCDKIYDLNMTKNVFL